MKLQLFFAATAIGAAAILSAAEPVKPVGICFRFDDNNNVSPAMKTVFDEAGYKCCFAVNSARLTPEQTARLKEFAADGFEIMDHTPNHRVMTFAADSPENAAKLASDPGVDHVAGNVVCLKYRVKKTLGGFTADLDGDKIFNLKPGVKKLRFLRRVSSGECFIATAADSNQFVLTDLWLCGKVDLGRAAGEKFEAVDPRGGIELPDAALRLLIRTSKANFSRLGLPAPTAWIQPGGASIPQLTGANLLRVLPSEGYLCAATYPNSSRKIMGAEHDADERFRMMWGDFNLERKSLEEVKTAIEKGLAQNRVMIGSSHMIVKKLKGGMPEYLELHRELLKWCKGKNIPVRTMSQWSRELFD